MALNTLPPPIASQPFCNISALEAGILQLPLHIVLDSASESDVASVPVLAFLLKHSSDPSKHLLFDLGARKDMEAYPPALQEHAAIFSPTVPQDIVGALANGKLTPHDVKTIAVSHVHWDHTGNPSLFQNAQFYLGAGGKKMYIDGYPSNPDSRYPTDQFPWDTRVTLLSSADDPKKWKPIGPFPYALDFWGDGSLYVVDAPGHIPGHLNLLARTSADGGWVYLAGDSAHDWCLLRATAGVKVERDEEGKIKFCMHMDPDAARETIHRIGEVAKMDRVRVILAHDKEWYEKNKGGPAFWPGKIDSL